MLLTLTIYAALIGLFAVIYAEVLSYEKVLNWWFRWGNRFEKKWFWEPIWGCYKCISGQIALWTYVLNWFIASQSIRTRANLAFIFKVVPNYHINDFSALNGAIFISETVAFSLLARWIISLITKK